MKTVILFSIKYEKMAIMYLWNVAGALHNPKAIFLYANTPKGQVKEVFS